MKRRMNMIVLVMISLLGVASCSEDQIPASVDWQDAMDHLKQMSPAFPKNSKAAYRQNEFVERWVYPEIKYAFVGWEDEEIESYIDDQLRSMGRLTSKSFVRVEALPDDQSGKIVIILTRELRTVVDEFEEDLFGSQSGSSHANASLWAGVIRGGSGADGKERTCVSVKSSGPYEVTAENGSISTPFVLKSFGVVAVYEGRKQQVVGCVVRSIFGSFGFATQKLTRRSILAGRPMTYLSLYDKAALQLFYSEHFPEVMKGKEFVETVERLENSYLRNARIKLPKSEKAFDIRMPWWEEVAAWPSSGSQ